MISNKEDEVKALILDYLRLKQKELTQKKKKSIRNKRYYLKHKDEITKKNKIKNELYKRFAKNF